MQTKLKLSNSRITTITDIVSIYIDHLADTVTAFRENLQPEEAQDNLLTQLSIASQLFEAFNKRSIKRYPVKHASIKMELHETILLYKALKHHESNTQDDYSRSIACLISTELHQQKPSISQINLKNLL